MYIGTTRLDEGGPFYLTNDKDFGNHNLHLFKYQTNYSNNYATLTSSFLLKVQPVTSVVSFLIKRQWLSVELNVRSLEEVAYILTESGSS